MAVRIAPGRQGDCRRAGVLGLIGLQVRRQIEQLGPKLILGLARVNPDEIGSPGQHPRGELVGAGPRRPLTLKALRIDPMGIFHDLTIFLAVNFQVRWNVTVDEIEREEDELGDVGVKGKLEPIRAGDPLVVGGLGRRHQVRPVISQAVDRLTEGQAAG